MGTRGDGPAGPDDAVFQHGTFPDDRTFADAGRAVDLCPDPDFGSRAGVVLPRLSPAAEMAWEGRASDGCVGIQVSFPRAQVPPIALIDHHPAEAASFDQVEKHGDYRVFFAVAEHGEEGRVAGVDAGELVGSGAASAIFAKYKVPAPKILAENVKKKVIVMQDLGETHLWDHHDSVWKKRSALYKATIDSIKKLHAVSADDLSDEQRESLEPEFDEALYGWEQDYFFDHFLSRFSRRAPSYVRSLRHEPVFAELATFLSALPRTLIHRDLQSQNVLIVRNKPVFIDHQGLRLGRPEYDIASLLYDPYVDFTTPERNELIRHAFEGRKRGEWRPIFLRCAAQRLMQALGAYGKLGEDDGREEFLGYIPGALNNLREVLEAEPMLPRLNPYLGEEALKL